MCYKYAVGIPEMLQTSLAGLDLCNPVIAAAGTCGYVDALADAMPLSSIGAITTKSITREPRPGSAPWRIIPARAGMLNAIGLANMGVARFLAEEAPKVRGCGTHVIASVAGHTIDDYVAVASAVDSCGAFRAIELNVSCPNTSTGRHFGADPATLREVLAAVRPAVTHCALFVKLAPDMVDPVAMADAAIASGANALTLCNTMPAMAIDVATRQPRLSRRQGGLSGPAIHPIVVRIVHDVYARVARTAGVPIIAIGGVFSWEDAAEFILAGATGVGMGTALFVDPASPMRVVRGLARWARAQQVTSISQLVGQVTQ
ncbi:MAG: dihydroorotate dehydrogenase [Phycisphaerales bacterium]|nr:dihydroorotate dehydrogenase [Phycisphaerales bacterium]